MNIKDIIGFLNPKYWLKRKKDQIIIKIKPDLISNIAPIKAGQPVFLQQAGKVV